jgi:dihydrofolate reductase
LFTRNQDREGPLNYDEFISEVGALAMGSTTYQWILDHESKDKDSAEQRWPYDVPCWVFTHRQLPVLPGAQIQLTSEDIAAVHERMVGAAGGRNVWIVGGETWPGSSRRRGCSTR